MGKKAGHLSNESSQDRLRQLQRGLRQQQEDDLRTILGQPRGRRFVWRLLEWANTFGGSFTAEPQITAYNEGRRSLGIDLMQESQRVAPTDYFHMLTEQLQAKSEDELRRQQAAATPREPPSNVDTSRAVTDSDNDD